MIDVFAVFNLLLQCVLVDHVVIVVVVHLLETGTRLLGRRFGLLIVVVLAVVVVDGLIKLVVVVVVVIVWQRVHASNLNYKIQIKF